MRRDIFPYIFIKQPLPINEIAAAAPKLKEGRPLISRLAWFLEVRRRPTSQNTPPPWSRLGIGGAGVSSNLT